MNKVDDYEWSTNPELINVHLMNTICYCYIGCDKKDKNTIVRFNIDFFIYLFISTNELGQYFV